MFAPPPVCYMDTPGGLVAYQTLGDGDIDLVHVAGWNQTVEGIWDLPMAAHAYHRLASFARVVLVDRRGTGLSDPVRHVYSGGDFGPWLEEAVADILSVLDAIGSERAALVSDFYGATVAIPLAATRPERVSALVLCDPVVRLLRSADYPWGMTPEQRAAVADWYLRTWGEGCLSGWTPSARSPGLNPTLRHDPAAHRWLARYERAGLPRGHLARWWRQWDFDVRPMLPLVQAPTLVMHHEENVIAPPREALDAVIAAIPDATGPVRIPWRNLSLWADQPPMVADEIERFLTGSVGRGSTARGTDRVFAVVLYTDLADSTQRAATMGDQRWKELLEVHLAVSARQIEAHRGRLVKSTGDGVLATFDAPARAVRCGQAIVADTRQLGCDAYAGLHAGEVELIGDDIAGITAHIAARVMSHAAPNEVLVSRTIKDLVAGSGLHFEDRGVHSLKGLPDEWHLYAAHT